MKHHVQTAGRVILLISLISLLGAGATQRSYGQSTGADYPQVLVNQAPVTFNGQTPIERDGHLLVPLRGVLETMGAQVDFDVTHQTVLASQGATRIALPIGASQATVNGQSVSLDVPAEIVNGSTMVPLRFVAEALGADVRYDSAAHLVTINTRPAPPPANASTSVRGVIVAVYPHVDPPRIVVRPDGTDGSSDQTIPLRPDAVLAVERPDRPQDPIPLDRLNIGSPVAVLVEGDGTASAVNVIAPALPPPPPPRYIAPDPGTTVFGTVDEIYSQVNPPRLVVRPDGTHGDADRTILIRPNAALTIQQPDGQQQPISLGQISPGAPVAVLVQRDGDALAVNLIAPPPPPRQGPPPPISLSFGVGVLEYRESDHDTFVLRLGDGRQLEVPKSGVFKNRPIDPGSTVLGTVVANYARINPPRIVVHPVGTPANTNRTILVRPNAVLTIQQPNGAQQPISLDRLAVGAPVAVLTERNGEAVAVNVIATAPPRAPAIPQFQGEYREHHEGHRDTFVVKIADGRQIEVLKNAPLFMNGQLMSWNDLRSGQGVSIDIDPKSGRGIRVQINTP